MDLGVAERLICPEAHATTPLVVRADRVQDRRMVQGLLGCPVCHREWSVADGVVQFGPINALPAVTATDAQVVAALLGLVEPMVIVVDGASASLVTTLSREFGASVISFDPDERMDYATVLAGVSRVAVAQGTVRAALMLRAARGAAFIQSAADVLTEGGRMVGAAAMPVPLGVREIARDDHWWVGERESAAAPISLRRGRA